LAFFTVAVNVSEPPEALTESVEFNGNVVVVVEEGGNVVVEVVVVVVVAIA
jgi:protein-L-isoaspartate O-methyltransferase